MKKFTFSLMLYAITTLAAVAQDQQFIYGRVYTVDGKVYEGPIRWGKEEVYWSDIFNASKPENENLRYLSSDDREELRERYAETHWAGNWGNKFTEYFGNWSNGVRFDSDREFIHQFSCQFGEIRTIRPQGRKYVEVELQGGRKLDLDGEGYNDVGLDIRVMDKELGDVEIYWNRIEKVEFMSTPSKLETKFGTPLYGTVEAFGEKFTGYIQWDHDERLTGDKLDGDGDDGDLSIEFGKIQSITRIGNRSRVVLKSGRELVMSGSNDVGSGHRGVIVMNKDFAAVDVPWDEFDKVTFTDKAPGDLLTYDQFKNQKEMSGSVTLKDGTTLSGKIAYDLDEELDCELLQGKYHEFEYTTAFRNVKKITPTGYDRCSVELKNGTKLTLEDAQDVDEKNSGLLIFEKGKDNPKYITWDRIKEITLD